LKNEVEYCCSRVKSNEIMQKMLQKGNIFSWGFGVVIGFHTPISDFFVTPGFFILDSSIAL